MLVYDKKFIEQTQEEILNFVKNPNDFKGYAIEFPEGLNDPPVREVCRMLNDIDNFESKEILTKYCILKKPVKVKLDDEYVDGGFIMNALTDDWDAFPTIKNHPFALTMLMEVCYSHLLKKYIPSSKNIPLSKRENKSKQTGA